MPDRLRAAVVVPVCETGLWLEVAPLFGFAEEYSARMQRMIACDPLNTCLSSFSRKRATCLKIDARPSGGLAAQVVGGCTEMARQLCGERRKPIRLPGPGSRFQP